MRTAIEYLFIVAGGGVAVVLALLAAHAAFGPPSLASDGPTLGDVARLLAVIIAWFGGVGLVAAALNRKL